MSVVVEGADYIVTEIVDPIAAGIDDVDADNHPEERHLGSTEIAEGCKKIFDLCHDYTDRLFHSCRQSRVLSLNVRVAAWRNSEMVGVPSQENADRRSP